MSPLVVGDEATVLRQRTSKLRCKAEVALRKAVDEQDLRARWIAPFIDGKSRSVGSPDVGPVPDGCSGRRPSGRDVIAASKG